MGQEPVCWPKKDFRLDPFDPDPTSQFPKVENEEYTIPSNSPFYVQLDEVPSKDDTSRVEVYLTDTLAEELTIDDNVVTVAHGSYFQTDDVLQIDDEQMQITGISGNDLNVERGYGGTDPATHTNGTRFWLTTAFVEQISYDYVLQAREYQVHYGTATIPYKAGLVRFAEAHSGAVVWITYYKTGHYIWAEFVNRKAVAYMPVLYGADRQYEGWTTAVSVKILIPDWAQYLRLKISAKNNHSGAGAKARFKIDNSYSPTLELAASETKNNNETYIDVKSISGWKTLEGRVYGGQIGDLVEISNGETYDAGSVYGFFAWEEDDEP